MRGLALLALLCVATGASADAGRIVTPVVVASSVAADPDPIFEFRPHARDSDASGVVNETDDAFGATTIIDCSIEDATATNLACDIGGTFAESDVNITAAMLGYATPFTSRTQRAAWLDRNYGWEADSTSRGEVDADTAFQIRFRGYVRDRGAAQYLVGKYDLANTQGYAIRITSAGVLQGVINNTTVGSFQLDSAGGWGDIGLTCSLDQCALDVNGKVRGSTAVRSGTLATTTSAKHFTIGCQSDGAAANCADTIVSNVRLKTCASCIVNASVADAVEKTHMQAAGIWPAHAVVAKPVKRERASPRTIMIRRDEDGQKKSMLYHFRLLDDWLAVERWQEAAADGAATMRDGRIVSGYNAEPQKTNLLKHSQDFNGASWAERNAGDSFFESGVMSPNQRWDEAARCFSDGTDGVEHGFEQTTASALTATENYIFSAYAAHLNGENTQYVCLVDDTLVEAFACFDVEVCQPAVVGDGARDFGTVINGGTEAAARVTPVGATAAADYEWCRMEVTIVGTAATHKMQILAVDDIATAAANDFTIATTSVSQRLLTTWGAQLEFADQTHPIRADRASSLISTASSTATRMADRLRFDYTNNPAGGGMMHVEIMLPDTGVSNDALNDYAVARNPSTTPCAIEDDDDLSSIRFEQSGEAQTTKYGINWEIMTDDVSQWADIFVGGRHGWRDGRIHWARFIYKTDDSRVYVDGLQTASFTDTSVTLPTIDSGGIAICYTDEFNEEECRGLLLGCTIYPASASEYRPPRP